MKCFAVLFSLLLVSSTALFAHPADHDGGFVETVVHLITHPSHLLTWVVALAVGAWLVSKAVRSRRSRVKKVDE